MSDSWATFHALSVVADSVLSAMRPRQGQFPTARHEPRARFGESKRRREEGMGRVGTDG